MKLTSDGRLIDRPTEELEGKAKEINKSNSEQKRLTATLDKLLNNTLIKVLKDHGITYELKYSNIYDNNKVCADVKITSCNLYYTYMDNYTGNTIAQKNKFRVITVELVQESSFIYRLTVYTSLSTTEFSAKKIPKLKHEFIINNKEQSIKGIYRHKEYVYDKDKDDDVVTYTVVNRKYKNTQETLADIDEYLANWLSRSLSEQESKEERKLPKELQITQINKSKELTNKVCNHLKTQGFIIEDIDEPSIQSNYNKVETIITTRINDIQVKFNFEQQLNNYTDTKISLYIVIKTQNSFAMKFSQKDFERNFEVDTNKNITNQQFLSLVVSFTKDYIKYTNCIHEDILPTIEANLESKLYKKIISEFGVIDKLSETSNNGLSRSYDIYKTENEVKLGVLNNYLSNKSIRFYIKFYIRAYAITYNDIDIKKDAYIGLTFTDKGIIIGSIDCEKIEDDDYGYPCKYVETPIISEKLKDISRISITDDRYTLNTSELEQALSREELLKRIGLHEINININAMKKIADIEQEHCNIVSNDYSLNRWIEARLSELETELVNNIFQKKIHSKKDKFTYLVNTSYRDEQRKISLLGLLSNSKLVIADYHCKKKLLGIIDSSESKDKVNISQLYPTICLEDHYLDDFLYHIENFNTKSMEVEETVDDIINELIHGKEEIKNNIEKIKEFAESIGIKAEPYMGYTRIDFGMKKCLMLSIENDFSNLYSDIATLKFYDMNKDSEYSQELCNIVTKKANNKIGEYTDQNKLTYELWFNSTIEIIKYIVDCIDEEQLKEGLNNFNEEEIDSMINDTDDEFNWI